MSQTVVNLTLPIVVAKIDHILDKNTPYRGQRAFASRDLRQKLAAYVLSRLPVVYIAMESQAACTMDSPSGCFSQEQHEHINQLIHEGIAALLEQPPAQPLGFVEVGPLPSSWFG
ncbi:MAG: late competence development ComFB family protein [Nodosilinea sp.]